MLDRYINYVDKLNGNYKETFKQISGYVNAEIIDEIRKEEILSEVLDSFLSAQEENKPVEQIVGADTEKFCKNLCSEKTVKSKVLYFAETLKFIVIIDWICCFSDLSIMFSSMDNGENTNFFTYKVSQNVLFYIFILTFGVLFAYIASKFLQKKVFSNKKSVKIFMSILGILGLIGIGLLIFFVSDKLDDFKTDLWVNMLVCAVITLICRIITKESRQYKKANKITFSEFAGINETVKNDVEEIEMKRFEKLNKKRQKKGMAEMKFAEFLDSEEKRFAKRYKKPLYYVVTLAVILIVVLALMYLAGEFETISDLVLFTAVNLAVEIPIMYFFYKMESVGLKLYIEWIQAKKYGE